ncbi:MAG TPA: hypothetical protein VM658_06360 [bacterium]|nr:hypothetical protein [bacterium]
MKRRGVAKTVGLLALALLASGLMYAVSAQDSDLCAQVDMKPVLSLQQVNQAELVHYMVVLAGLAPPSAEGMSPEQFYQEEVKLLVDNGYPPILSDTEPDRLVTRRYFASVMYQLALLTDPDFASKYSGLANETDQLNALVESEWIYAEEGRMYREELLSVLCNHTIKIIPPAAISIAPEEIMEAIIEAPRSPI